jgi:hypothetical protein
MSDKKNKAGFALKRYSFEVTKTTDFTFLAPSELSPGEIEQLKESIVDEIMAGDFYVEWDVTESITPVADYEMSFDELLRIARRERHVFPKDYLVLSDDRTSLIDEADVTWTKSPSFVEAVIQAVAPPPTDESHLQLLLPLAPVDE